MIKIRLLTIVLNKNSVRLATCPGIGDNSVEIFYLCKDKHENSDDTSYSIEMRISTAKGNDWRTCCPIESNVGERLCEE